MKDTLWEGGVKGAAFVWSPLLKTAPRVSEQMMNVQDWLPTLYEAAGLLINILTFKICFTLQTQSCCREG